MIVTRTPFRVTLGGGGTDLPSYYSQHGGFIFAMGLDKYMYVTVNRPTVGSKIRLHYSQSEVVDDIDDLRHELAREALRAHGVRYGFEVASIADLPAGPIRQKHNRADTSRFPRAARPDAAVR